MLEPNFPSKPFIGVCFVLFGFDPTTESQVRTKLLNGGGVDAGLYSQRCTHVIVDKIVYDDPLCITARNDGKTVVTELWVDHSYDIGLAVDIASIMYRPPRDLNGIPGANNLIICLTGYQRQDREDIMTMVNLMGARFSKPLVANKVTHLICYKFEGEKYELAYKLKKIKLVNHLWLEDCLRDWELLPEDNYNKSGYEMEMMEAEAKDSEEEADNNTERQLSFKMVNKSPQLKIGTPKHSPLPKSIGEVQKVLSSSSEPENLPGAANDLLATGRKVGDDPASGFSINNVQVEPASLDTGTSSILPNPQLGTPNIRRDSIVESLSRSAEKSHFDSRSSAISYTRKSPRELPFSNFSDELGNVVGPLKMQLGGPSGVTPGKDASNTPSKDEYVKEIIRSGHAEYLQGSEILYKEESSIKRQKLDVSCSPLKQQDISSDVQATVKVSPSVCCKSLLSDSPSLVDGLSDINKSSTPGAKCGIVIPSDAKRSQADISTAKSSASEERLARQSPPHLTAKALCEESLNKMKPLNSSRGLRNSSFVEKPETKYEHLITEARTQLHQQEENQVPTPSNGNKEMEKSHTIFNMEDLQEVDENLPTKLIRKKTIAKRTWGSRPALKKAGKQKGSIYSSKSEVQNDPPMVLSTETAAYEKFNNANESETLLASDEKFNNTNESETLPAAVNVNEVVVVETGSSRNPKTNVESEANFTDDETEPPEDKNESVGVHNEDGLEMANLVHKSDNMDSEQEGAQHSTKNIPAGKNDGLKEHDSIQLQHSTENASARKVFEETEAENVLDRQELNDGKKSKGKAVKKLKAKPNYKECVKNKMGSGKNLESSMKVDKEKNPIVDGVASCASFMYDETEPPGDKNVSVDVHKEDYSEMANLLHKSDNIDIEPEGAQHSTKNITAGKVLEEAEVENVSDKQETNDAKKSKGKAVKKPKAKLNSKECVKRNMGSGKNLKSSMKVEKENNPIVDGVASCADNQKSRKITSGCLPLTENRKLMKGEPACFILSGHRLQRKDFQQVIRRLKGKFCRDSHQWSYQATHFIAPDPIRRTEKFFAAAASGRWILKTDYLSACSQAGKFLEEQPYEWHKIGLSEDGTINLEAPRKWRLLREKTGHGAFYGMRIIIYGECIAPPLDTLKRVVKAGDGTILATSPPYSRFLSSGVDFAIVSPAMLPADMWVQEFLRHEIPCVVADYLVEYVCKPGYSLEKHVLYNTHAWVDKSLANLSSKAEEIVENLQSDDDHKDEDNDIACEACGSFDRGDVMLICGDESGSVGCGKGMHLDCNDPPLETIPEDDWFCPSCITTLKKRKRGKSVKKK